MYGRRRRTATLLLLIAATLSVALGSTVSAYTGSATAASDHFAAAADWTAPSASAAAVGRTTAYDTGSIMQGGSYYIYAEVTDTGNPASGVASVTANVSSLTTGATAIALTSGSYSAGGISYDYRSVAKTATTPLAAGSHSFTVISTDAAANTTTQSYSVTVDNTAPAGSDVQAANHTGGIVGRIEQGDTLTLTYNATMDPFSIFGGWTGASTPVQVALVDGGTSSDYLLVYTPAATPTPTELGTVTLGNDGYITTGSGNYDSFGLTGAATPSTMTRTGAVITVTLGTASAATNTVTAAATMTWTPSATATDIAGNPAATTTVTESGAADANF
jgi:hypothetical protein